MRSSMDRLLTRQFNSISIAILLRNAAEENKFILPTGSASEGRENMKTTMRIVSVVSVLLLAPTAAWTWVAVAGHDPGLAFFHIAHTTVSTDMHVILMQSPQSGQIYETAYKDCPASANCMPPWPYFDFNFVNAGEGIRNAFDDAAPMVVDNENLYFAYLTRALYDN